jgi:protein phosphatase
MSFSGRKRGLRSGSKTSVGRVRENNEDSLHVIAGDDYVVAVVADGMGGAVAGEEASRLAVEAVKTGLAQLPEDDNAHKYRTEQIAQKLRTAIRAGNESIVQRAAKAPELRGMGTTVTLAYIRYTQAVIAHVGDSRAYLVSDNSLPRIQQITADHSFVDALVLAGHLTQEQADEHPMRHVLYRALGQTEELDIDVYQTRLRPGDRVVLCSDGLTRHVKPNEIADLVLENEEPGDASQALVDLANARGGEDNVSVIVVVVDGDSKVDETPLVVMAVSPNSIQEPTHETGETIPIARATLEDNKTLPSLDSNHAPSPERAEEDDTLPDRDQLDKRARLMQLQWLMDEVEMEPDPGDRAITHRTALFLDQLPITHHNSAYDEDGYDPRTPEQ